MPTLPVIPSPPPPQRYRPARLLTRLATTLHLLGCGGVALAQQAATAADHGDTPISAAADAGTTGVPDSAAPTDAQPLQTVTVAGVRASNARTIAAKRDAIIALDTVAANEIGQLPDFNVGDALKRITGVNVLLYQGEPRFVIVRGLNANYNTTLIDGYTVPSADIGGRQVYMELLPANFARRIDVAKSAAPELDGGAIGGVVNILTGSAFAYPDGLLELSGKLGRNLGAGADGGARPAGEASVKWAKRLGDDNAFGLVIDASYWRRDINVPQLEAGGALNWYDDAGVRQPLHYAGNGIAVPAQRLWYNYDNQRERYGANARLDWRGRGALSGHLAAYDFQQRERSDRSDLAANVAAGATVNAQSPTGGVIGPVGQTAQLGRLRWDRALYGVNGELALAPETAPGWQANLRGSVARSTVDNPQAWDNFAQNGLRYAYTYGPGASPDYPVFQPADAASAANAADMRRYRAVYHREESTTYAATVKDVQSNLRFNSGDDNRGWGGALGARWLRTDTRTAFARTTWSGAGYTLADVASGATRCGEGCAAGDLAPGGIPLISPSLADAAFAQARGAMAAAVDVAAQNGATYGVREQVDAAYAQSRYRTDTLLLLAGARVERTSFDSDGLQAVDGVYRPVSPSSRYHNVLPSALAVLDTGNDSKLRLGWSKTLGRPRFDQQATHGGALISTGGIATLATGNAELVARTSTNLDLGHDWYLDGGKGIVSLALFHKRIHNEIFTYGSNGIVDVNGTPTPALITQARNAAGVVTLSGVEIGVTKDFTFLPAAWRGFGASANATLTRASYPLTLSDGSQTTLSALPQQPKRIWNLALYYEQGPWHGKLAWNHIDRLWDDRFPNYTATEFYRNRYQRATNNVDWQLSYDVNRRVSLSFDVLNLTGQGIRTDIGRQQEYFQAGWKLRPTVMLGLNAKL